MVWLVKVQLKSFISSHVVRSIHVPLADDGMSSDFEQGPAGLGVGVLVADSDVVALADEFDVLVGDESLAAAPSAES